MRYWPIALRDRKCGGFAHIRARVGCALLDSEDHNTADHGHADTAEYAERHRSNQRVLVVQILLKGVDG